MPAEESSNPRRNDHMQRMPSNGYQQNGSGFYRTADQQQRLPRARAATQLWLRSALSRSEPRQYTPPPRSEPPRSYTPPPRQEPRSQLQPPRSSPSNNNNGGGNNGGGNRGGNRPWSSPKER